ncbi:hypothetical protein [Liquorilactobacillus sicerae]|uniref:hypothetical protein n=1 Tax=Liquorilactobacillus sicerae TaxID=1416943 RepID=UPI002481047B|nr:hypothetical protein [Liquorilactobacillus sicerae]
MNFWKKNHRWYSLALDTKKQVFIAQANADPQLKVEASTIESALDQLKQLTKDTHE